MRVFRATNGKIYQILGKEKIQLWNPVMPLKFVGHMRENVIGTYHLSVRKAVEEYLEEIYTEIGIPKFLEAMTNDDPRKRITETMCSYLEELGRRTPAIVDAIMAPLTAHLGGETHEIIQFAKTVLQLVRGKIDQEVFNEKKLKLEIPGIIHQFENEDVDQWVPPARLRELEKLHKKDPTLFKYLLGDVREKFPNTELYFTIDGIVRRERQEITEHDFKQLTGAFNVQKFLAELQQLSSDELIIETLERKIEDNNIHLVEMSLKDLKAVFRGTKIGEIAELCLKVASGDLRKQSYTTQKKRLLAG
jgi:hypothetical protein